MKESQPDSNIQSGISSLIYYILNKIIQQIVDILMTGSPEKFKDIFSSVKFISVAQSCTTLCDTMNRITPGLAVHHQLRSSLRLTFIESVMPSSHLILCHPLLLLLPISPSIRVFSSESTLP